jgi:hypothetical protein
MNERLGDFSIREKNLWFEVIVDVAVAGYYWPRVYRLMLAGDDALLGRDMAELITKTILWAITVAIVLGIFLHNQQKPEPMDERYRQIAMRGTQWSKHVLAACVLILMAYVAGMELMPDSMTERNIFTLTPLLMAHLLLVALMLTSFTDKLVKLFSYRRGY